MTCFRLLVLGLASLLSLAGLATAQEAAPPSREDVVRSFYAAWNAEDFDSALSVLAPDAVWVDPKLKRMPFGGSRRGQDEIRGKVLAAIAANWDGFTIALDQVVRNSNQVFVSGTVTAFGRKSGRLLQLPYGAVWTVKDGVVSRVTTFFVPEKMLGTL
jgi:ketosteroid isomerase-like protein